MKIITKEIEQAFKKQGDTSELEAKDINIVLKLFGGPIAMYVYEHLEDDVYMAFCDLGDPQMAEMSSISLDEVMNMRVPPFGLLIERDRFYANETLQGVLDRYEKIRGY